MRVVSLKSLIKKLILSILILMIFMGIGAPIVYGMGDFHQRDDEIQRNNPSAAAVINTGLSKVNVEFLTAPEGGAQAGAVITGPIKALMLLIGDAVQWAFQGIVFGEAHLVAFPVQTMVQQGKFWDEYENVFQKIGRWFAGGGNTIFYPGNMILTPEAMFKNQISMLDPDFIHDRNTNQYLDKNKFSSSIEQLRNYIASWYKALRMIALVGLLTVLVYVGLRIVISSSTQDKAKYKQMVTDWVVAIALIFVLHYIMAFTFTMVGKINEILAGGTGGQSFIQLAYVGEKTIQHRQLAYPNENNKWTDYIDSVYGSSAGLLYEKQRWR